MLIVLLLSLIFLNRKVSNVQNFVIEKTNEPCRIDTLYLYDTLLVSNKFSDKFRSMLDTMNIPHADMVYAQAIIESGNFTAKNARESNNYFGMLQSNGSLIHFDHWIESIVYYKNHFSKRYTNPNEDYAEFLYRINYFPDRSYIQILKKVTNESRRHSSVNA